MQSDALATLIAAKRAKPYREDQSIAELRAESEARARALPADVKVTEVSMNGVPATWFDAPGARPERVFLFFHGGGYYRGSVSASRDTAARFSAATRARCLSVEYRLAPEHPYPAAVDDAHAAWQALIDSGVAPSRVVVGGISAGGGLTLALVLRLRRLGQALPAGIAPLSPWTDLTQSGATYGTHQHLDPAISKAYLDRMAALYAGSHDPAGEETSPLFADLSGLPPMLVQVGTAEVLLDDSRVLAERAGNAGVSVTLEQWDDMIHGWHGMAHQLPEGADAIERVGEFAQDCMD